MLRVALFLGCLVGISVSTYSTDRVEDNDNDTKTTKLREETAYGRQ